MLGNKLITKQTPPGGVPVNHVMIAESVDIFEEKYLCFILDRLIWTISKYLIENLVILIYVNA